METTAHHAHDRPKAARAVQAALAPLSVHEVYPLEVFKQRSGLDAWALRQARRNGLRVVTIGRRRFVTGADFVAYIEQIAEQVITADR